MFCPGCGSEEKQANQFCRACGTDLQRVRLAVATPDSITASAVSARDEIGRAVAAKIRETQDTYELKKVAEDVLPEIEKFLESPHEKRLRRMRVGMLLASIGLGTAIGISIVAVAAGEAEMLILAAFGVVAFFLGLGFILNGVFLTVPKTSLVNRSSDAERQRELDGVTSQTNDLQLPERPAGFASVTEHTTHHLNEKLPVRRD